MSAVIKLSKTNPGVSTSLGFAQGFAPFPAGLLMVTLAQGDILESLETCWIFSA